MPKAHCDDHRTMSSGKETNWGPTRTSTSDPRKDGMVYGPRGLGSRSRHSSRRSHDLPRRLGRPTIGRRATGSCTQGQGLRGRVMRKSSLSPKIQVQGTGEPRASKGACVVLKGTAGKGLCQQQYLACRLPYLERTLDLSFVRDFVQQTYAGGGRPSVDPVVFWHRSNS
jgi:hypothetical protein